MEEREKFWASCGYNKEDLAEVMCLYIKAEKITLEGMVEKTEMAENTIKSSLKGKGNHVYNLFEKFCSAYGLKVEINVSES